MLHDTNTRCRVVVLISGSGSNLQSILDRADKPDAGYQVVAALSNNAGAYGLSRAAAAGVATAVVDHRQFASREVFDQALADCVDGFAPDLVVLAGFMRILTPVFVDRYQGRLLNIHPSLLPKYPGLNTHQRALDAGDSEAGCSVHFVTRDLDGGPLIAQARVPVCTGDDAAQLAARVLREEHRLYPEVICWFAHGRLRLQGDRALLDQQAPPQRQRVAGDR